MLPWDIEMTVEESLSDDEDGVPHGVPDSESTSDKESDYILASCDTEGIRLFLFYIISSTFFLYFIFIFFVYLIFRTRSEPV
jgi:hypothetical protein